MKIKVLFVLNLFLLFYAHELCSQQIKVSTYGFEINASEALRSAIASSHDSLVIDKQNIPWIIEPMRFVGISNKVIIIEEGVEILAKIGAFPRKGDALLSFRNSAGIRILGNGAKLQMNKEEYLEWEWRHGISIWNCTDVYIEKLTICDTGGDGIFIDGTSEGSYSENIVIRDILSTNNKRQGMSIISAKNVFVYNSVFQNTIGTLPSAGVDLEPDSKQDRMENINFYDCTFKNNYNSGIKVTLIKLESDSKPVSIKFENCVLQNNHSKANNRVASEITIGAHKTRPVKGSLRFENCLIENSQWGLFYSRKINTAYEVVFKDCTVRNICQDGSYPVMYLEVPDYYTGNFSLGGFRFENLIMDYKATVPLLKIRGSRLNTLSEVVNISGKITILGNTPKVYQYIKYDSSNNKNVDLELIYTGIKME